MKRIFASFLLFLCLAVVSPVAWAVSYNGSISVADRFLFASGTWSNANDSTPTFLSWNVNNEDNEDNSGAWIYSYTFYSPDPALSHAIVEVSSKPGSEFSEKNILKGTSSPYEIGTYSQIGIGNSNPGLPGDIFGMKWGFEQWESGSFSWFIFTDRAPMWGDFYAKGGSNEKVGYAYNSNFGKDTDAAIGNGNADGWVLVPDSVPEPATMLLLGLGLVGLAFVGRRKFLK